MAAPTFDFDLFGAGATLHARKDNFNFHMNAALQALWNDLADNVGKMYASRAQAVNDGQANLPFNFQMIATLEGQDLVIRRPHLETDDPLFATSPFWGVEFRLQSGDWRSLRTSMAKSFVDRAQAVAAGQELLAPGIGPIFVRNGDYLEMRGPGQTEDQLFPTFPNWGVLDRFPDVGLLNGKADILNSGKTFGSRQQAVDYTQALLPAAVGLILVREGNYLAIRGPGQTEDQLFAEYPNWGILDRLPVNGLFVSTVSQAGIIHLVGEAATVAGDVTTITAELAPASLTAGLTVGPGTKAMLTLPPALDGELQLQVADDTARPIRREQNDVTARAEDVEPGSTLLLRQFGGNWVIQSGAVGIATIENLRDSVALLGQPVDGFENAFREGFLTIGTGQIASASASWTYTDFIPVSRGQVVDYVGQINRDQGAAIAYYDSNQTYLNDGLVADPAGSAPLQPVSGTVTIPAGVAFIRAATLNTVAHRLSYVPSAASPEAFAEGVISVMEHVSGTEKLRLQAAINALLSGSALPSTLANLPGIGDSFTVGANATTVANRFLNRVATALGATVTNYGQGGTVLQNSNGSGGAPLNGNGRDRFRALFMGSAKKDFALIAYGFNDARYTAAPATFNVAAYQSDYREMIVGLLGDGYRRDQILVVGPHYITDVGLTTGSDGFTGQTRAGFEAYVTAAQDVAEEFGVLYFDSYAYMRDNGGATLIDTDNIHPTNEGHEVIATGILQETTVLNQRSAPAISGWQGSGTALTLTWGSVAGAVSYEVARARFDTLVVTAATASQTSNSHEFTGLAAGQYVGMVRAVFSDGPGPWSVSTPRTI